MMQVLNLFRQFELLRMKKEENIQENIDKLLRLVTQLRMLGGKVIEKG